MIEGTLDPTFVAWAIARGQLRAEISRSKDLVGESHSGGVSGSFDGEGAVGECIVAAVFGLPYPPVEGTYKREPDVGPLEVQTVLIHEDTKGSNLLLRPTDGDALERPYVLVHLDAPDGTASSARAFKILGWIGGRQGYAEGEESWWPGDKCRVVSPQRLLPFNSTFFEWLSAWKEKIA